MGRGRGGIDDLFYGTQLGPRIEPLDSLDPSDDTMSWVKELLQDAKAGKLDSAVYALEMIGKPKGDVAQYPAMQALLMGLADMQLRKFLRKEKLKLKVTGARAEQKEILSLLAGDIVDRFWAQPEVDPESGDQLPLPSPQDRITVQGQDIMMAALRNESDPSPIADQYRERISTTDMSRLDEDFLRAALGPDASDKTKEAVDESLNRSVVASASEWARRFGLEPQVSGTEAPYGVARASYKGSAILHLRDPSYRWQSVCGKRITRSARYGAWSDASSGADYRRCKDCEKKATADLRKTAEGQKAGAGDNYFPAEQAQKVEAISKSPEIEKAVKKWQKGSDEVDVLQRQIAEVTAKEIAPILTDSMDSPDAKAAYGHPLFSMMPSPLRRKLQDSGLWEYGEDDKMRERLFEMFPEDVRRKTVEMIVASGGSVSHYSYHDETGQKILKLLDPYVDDYVAKNGTTPDSGN